MRRLEAAITMIVGTFLPRREAAKVALAAAQSQLLCCEAQNVRRDD